MTPARRPDAARSALPFGVVIPGQPVGKGRARVTRWGTHTPEKTASWESKAALAFWEAWHQDAPIEAPVALRVIAAAKRPQRLLRKKDPDGRLWRCSKPDLDNVVKSVADAMVAGGMIRDDTQIVVIEALSVYCARNEVPSVAAWVAEAPDSPEGQAAEWVRRAAGVADG